MRRRVVLAEVPASELRAEVLRREPLLARYAQRACDRALERQLSAAAC